VIAAVSFAARAPRLRFRDRPTCGPLCEAGVAKRKTDSAD
jgi:hypothetical protein